MRTLDREGIFKARPLSWQVRESESSQSVGIEIEFQIIDQLDGSDWVSWAEYQPHHVFGTYWVIKKDGKINTATVEQLVEALGWIGDLRTIAQPPPSDVVVQITVKEDEYNGVVRYKAGWINPGDFTPRPQGASEGDLDQLQSRFGSLLRAAASGAKPAPTKAAAPTQAKPDGPTCPISGEQLDDERLTLLDHLLNADPHRVSTAMKSVKLEGEPKDLPLESLRALCDVVFGEAA